MMLSLEKIENVRCYIYKTYCGNEILGEKIICMKFFLALNIIEKDILVDGKFFGKIIFRRGIVRYIRINIFRNLRNNSVFSSR